LVACAILSLACAAADDSSSAYLTAAEQTASWLRSTRVEAGWGIVAPDETFGEPVSTEGIGTGAAGRALFYLELFHATAVASYLADARAEADLLLREETPAGGSASPGLYNGSAGMAFVLNEVHKADGDMRFRDGALHLIAALHRSVRRDAGGIYWNEYNDVLNGTAGIGLSLLYAAREMGHASSLRLAEEAGEALLNRAERADSGMAWNLGPENDFNLPNFSHGTAGVGYFLATLYQSSGRGEFLEAAERAAAYLMSVADRREGLFLVPYGIPNEGFVTRYDIGWAHGPAGTARLFYRLWQITGSRAYGDVVLASARSIAAAGVPGASSDPASWSGPFRLDRRFGTAGAAEFLLKLYAATDDSAHFALGREVVDSILARATVSDAGLHWELPRYGFQGDEGSRAAFTGYHYGAAGMGLLLLQLHRISNGSAPIVILPDDPFGGE
jgi:lantibiotic modifying enzyme